MSISVLALQGCCHCITFSGYLLNLLCVHSFGQGQEESNGPFESQGEGESTCTGHVPAVFISLHLSSGKFCSDRGSLLSFVGLGAAVPDDTLEITPGQRPERGTCTELPPLGTVLGLFWVTGGLGKCPLGSGKPLHC